MNNINCLHFNVCSGCSRNRDVDKLEVFIEAQHFFANKGIHDLKLYTGKACGWRCRAKLAVRGTSSHPLIGLFKAHSHHLVNIPFCQVHHPTINHAAEALRSWITTQNITTYDENTGMGLLRYVQLAVDRSSNKIQLVLVLNIDSNCDQKQDEIESLWKTHKELWHSIWVNFNTRRDNVIFGEKWNHLFGEKWLWERLLNREICFHPASFVQANLEMFERLLMRISECIFLESSILDLYAGVGAIGLALVDKCRQVCCVEINPQSEACFKESYLRLPQELQPRISFVTCSVNGQTHLLDNDIDVLIVDPPRKGLDRPLLEVLCKKTRIKRLIYVSCGWKSFKHDCQVLLDAGWNLYLAETFLFFPGTDHIEVLAIFDRCCK